ncbi:MAG: hypothetical protein JNK90_28560 [Planctomycetaceae bacterium]|nr:hypothetical protein [Planctomycetaceae bacterium]
MALFMISSQKHQAYPNSANWRHSLVGIGFLLTIVGCTSEKSAATKPTESAITTPAVSRVRAELPAQRDQSFVGSEACRECHAKISEVYDQHPMGMSISQVSNMKRIEQPAADWLNVAGPDKYRVNLEEAVANKPTHLTHQQLHLAEDGSPLGEVTEPIAFAIGSGQKGRAYFVFKDQMLFQSPLGWYTAKNCWDLSPGYNPVRHPGFQRRIDESCLYCHAGRVDSQNSQQFASKVFHEAVIGCERCHGPGEKHIAYQRNLKNTPTSQSATTKSVDPICNPSDLTAAQREDVCNQCHLQAEQVIPRFGRSFFDFRPGDRLEDVFVVFSSSTRQESRGSFRAVSHVEQMRQSRCYQASQEKMGCISCHDPHQVPEPQLRVEQFRLSCLKCHSEKGCSLPDDERKAQSPENSCIDCHMPKSDISNVPHTAQTDHRILRSPKTAPESKNIKAWTVVDGAGDRLPAWEIQRARGLTMMITAVKKRDTAMAIKAREYLTPDGIDPLDSRQVIATLANDGDSLSAIASSYWLEGLFANARPLWEKTLELQPNHETALSGLTQIDLDANDLTSAERNAKKLTDFAPAEATHWAQLSSIQWKMSKFEDAIKAAETALRLDPNMDDTRDWLKQAKQKLAEGSLTPELDTQN